MSTNLEMSTNLGPEKKVNFQALRRQSNFTAPAQETPTDPVPKKVNFQALRRQSNFTAPAQETPTDPVPKSNDTAPIEVPMTQLSTVNPIQDESDDIPPA